MQTLVNLLNMAALLKTLNVAEYLRIPLKNPKLKAFQKALKMKQN